MTRARPRGVPASPAAGAGAGPELRRDAEWQRLDPRMLLVHPIRELVRFLPVMILFVLGSTAAGGERWQLIGVAFPIALGLLRYLTTSFRISGGRIELQRGLLNRHVLSTPVDRVRTVDLTSSLIHRALGLTKVRIGTGTASTSDEDLIDLDGLPLDRARELREELLHTTHTADPDDPAAPEVAPERDVLTFDPCLGAVRPAHRQRRGHRRRRARCAEPAALVGRLLRAARRCDDVDLPGLPLAVLVPLGVLAVLVVISLLSIGGYLVTNYNFRLTRPRGATTWHLTRGLFTTRETTLDDERVAGVNLSEPVGLRLARGARLSAIVTGLDRSQQGSSALVPPAPRVRRRARRPRGARLPRARRRPPAEPRPARRPPPLDPRPRPRAGPRRARRRARRPGRPDLAARSACSPSPSAPCSPATASAPSATPSSPATSSPAPAPSCAAAGSSRSTT